MGWLYIIPILAFLIIIHEFGHFFAARSVGVEVEEFGIGIPPRIKGWRRKGVLWSVNAIPFGGFVRVRGEDGKDIAKGSYNAATPWQRAWFLFAGPLMNLLVALLLTIMLVTIQGQPTRISPLYINEVAPGSPAEEAGWLPGDRVIRVGNDDVASASDAVAAIRAHAGEPVDVVIQRGNDQITSTVTPRRNPPANQGAIGITFMNGTLSDITVTGVSPDSPAATAGIQEGDRIVAVNNIRIDAYAQAMSLINQAQGQTAQLTIARDGQEQTLDVAIPAPRLMILNVNAGSAASDAMLYTNDEIISVNGQPVRSGTAFTSTLVEHRGETLPLTIERDGQQHDITLRIPNFDAATTDAVAALGMRAAPVSGAGSAGMTTLGNVLYEPVPPSQILQRGTSEFWNLVSATGNGLKQMAQGNVSRDQLAGPVGMAQITGELLDRSAQPQWVTLTNITVMVSLSLGVLNLLPFPALDGGRLMFVALEIIRGGRKIAPEKEGMVHMVGMLILLGLMFFIMYGDITRIIDGKDFLP